jgi:phosphoglycerol transferase MdoB-like AlkP superfamily enzyme
MINTGLLPIYTGTVFYRFYNNKYFTLAGALKKAGYRSTSFMGNQPSFWHQGTMNPALGFDSLVSVLDYAVSDTAMIGMGLSDNSFFHQSISKIRNLRQPFYIQMITLSSHFPFELPLTERRAHFPADLPRGLASYLLSIHYVDEAIGAFIDELKRDGLFDRCVVVITGDHEALPRDLRESYMDNKYVKGWLTRLHYVPLLILNSPAVLEYEGVLGQIDIYPTILSLMGISNYPWKGLGTSILCGEKHEFAVDPRMNVVGDTAQVAQELIQHAISAWQVSDLIITRDYFANKK